jgi:hypothetical protein
MEMMVGHYRLDFLKKVVNTVERHPSTLGHEVFGESKFIK